MNLTALRRVRDAMAAHPDRIRMNIGWGDATDGDALCADPMTYPRLLSAGGAFAACDTAGCIAGWTVATVDPDFLLIKNGRLTSFTDLADHAADLLGIGPREAKELFYGQWAARRDLGQITPQEVLRHLDGLLAPADCRGGMTAPRRVTFSVSFELPPEADAGDGATFVMMAIANAVDDNSLPGLDRSSVRVNRINNPRRLGHWHRAAVSPGPDRGSAQG